MQDPIAVRGLRELQAAFALADRETQKGLRTGLREVAEPVRVDAALLASTSIRRIGLKWSQMRTGVTRKLVYVAPKQRGIKTRGPDPRRRRNLGTLLAERAMEPALHRHENEIEGRVEQLLDDVADGFNHRGVGAIP